MKRKRRKGRGARDAPDAGDEDAFHSEREEGGREMWRVDAVSELFSDRPRYRPTYFLGRCFKLFRVISESSRGHEYSTPYCPRGAVRGLVCF